MALYCKGILGEFKNRVGTVVGRRWKPGKWAMASYQKYVRNPQTEEQLLIRARFSTLGEIASAFLAPIRIGLRNFAKRVQSTEIGEFVKLNWEAVEADSVDNVTVDFASMICAKGPLPNVQFGSPQFDTPQQADVAFDTNEEVDGTSLNDNVYLFAYCPDAKCGVLSPASKRSDKSVSVTVPAYWNGMKVHLWGFTEGTDKTGRNPTYGKLSNSVYIGSGNIG